MIVKNLNFKYTKEIYRIEKMVRREIYRTENIQQKIEDSIEKRRQYRKVIYRIEKIVIEKRKQYTKGIYRIEKIVQKIEDSIEKEFQADLTIDTLFKIYKISLLDTCLFFLYIVCGKQVKFDRASMFGLQFHNSKM